MKSATVVPVLVILLCFLASASPATFVTIDFPGAIYTTLNGGPNPSGDAVGTYIDAAKKSHGFLFSHDGEFKTIDFPGAAQTALNGSINAEGDIVGQYTDNSQVTHGFLLAGGTFTTIDYPGATFTSLGGINPRREIVGTYCLGSQCGVFTYNEGKFDPVTISNGVLSWGVAVNPSGTLFVSCVINGKTHACVIDRGQTTMVDYPGALGTSAGAEDAANDLAGAWTDAQFHTHGFMERRGVFTSFDPPGSTFTYASGIREDGTVIGQYYDSAGKSHGFIMSLPLPRRRAFDERLNIPEPGFGEQSE
ncbi:MAG TPA: hypothetical protein VKT49_00630 [Bryobacteraceae bacterium]|nr:hypothetical protein [Bryobacteraceae bacterium]